MTETTAPSVPDATDRSLLIRAGILGVVAGFLAGLFGVGGGILIVPALVAFLHFEQRLAHGTSLAAVLPIAVSSLVSYSIEGEVDWAVGAFLAIGAIGGAVIGTHILHKLPHDVLAVVFISFLALTAVRLLIDRSEATGRPALSVVGAIVLVLVGVASGILAGLLGVGGGIIMVPAMVVGFGVPAALAKGTSLFVIVPTSIMGTWRNRTKKNVAPRVAVVVGLAGVVSGFLASKLSVGMSETLSNLLFAALLIVVAARMAWQLRNERAARRSAPA